ncbi:response regulator [Agrobacterium tumefaciens]|uniref:response regulator n=1 Tax=Agrobacterium tumefaciens TaxID=358 RepID=UPI002785549A|nr:response regulator [Agrobacterium tumefaciens]MDP9857472.1 FixJ family two-component response regulator [Agrobacterium tumefaciens]
MLLETLVQANTLIGIVDDDPDIILAVSSLVRSFGYEVECFHSAAALLRRFNFEDFLCIISDFQMPSMNGLELAKALLDLEPNLPVILMTGEKELNLERMAHASGAISVVAKPFSFDEIGAHLNKAVSHRSRG